MENMKPVLAFNTRRCLFRDMRRRLVHYDDQVSLAMILQHLGQEVNDLLRSDPFVMELEDQTATAGVADIAETPARFPVTFCLGVCPQDTQVFPKSAVSE